MKLIVIHSLSQMLCFSGKEKEREKSNKEDKNNEIRAVLGFCFYTRRTCDPDSDRRTGKRNAVGV